MALLNTNIPSFRGWVHTAWLTKNEGDKGKYEECYIFAAQSVSGKILTFHIITPYGAVRSRVPLSELYHHPPMEGDVPLDYKQLWDCFSENISVIKYEYLSGRECDVVLKDKKVERCIYLFTIDWFDNPYSDNAYDYKCGHILYSKENGYLLCQPNNRIIRWYDINYCTIEAPTANGWRVDTEIPTVEVGGKWLPDNEKYQY